jgi:hypothetical protein
VSVAAAAPKASKPASKPVAAEAAQELPGSAAAGGPGRKVGSTVAASAALGEPDAKRQRIEAIQAFATTGPALAAAAEEFKKSGHHEWADVTLQQLKELSAAAGIPLPGSRK